MSCGLFGSRYQMMVMLNKIFSVILGKNLFTSLVIILVLLQTSHFLRKIHSIHYQSFLLSPFNSNNQIGRKSHSPNVKRKLSLTIKIKSEKDELDSYHTCKEFDHLSMVDDHLICYFSDMQYFWFWTWKYEICFLFIVLVSWDCLLLIWCTWS